MKNTLERRLKLLNMEGLGFSRHEITKELTTLFDCTPRTIQYDFKNRGKWQPLLEQYDPKTSLLKITNRYNTIYRKACFKLLQSQNEMVQLGALRIMLESSKALREVTIPKEQQPTEPTPEAEERWYDHDSLTEKEKETLQEAARLMMRIERKGPKPYVHIH